MIAWSQLSFQESSSVLMEPVDHFHDILLLMMTAVILVISTSGLLMSNLKVVTTMTTENNALELLWTALPAVILIVLGIPSLSLLYSMDEQLSALATLSVTGHQWYWTYGMPDVMNSEWDSYMSQSNKPQDIRLLEVDNRVLLPMMTPIRILVTSEDVLHAWSLSSAGLKIDATPGRISQLTVSLIKSGLLYGQCSELCGVNHSFMPIVVEVCDWSSYLVWLKSIPSS